jgi:hypothetical protein
MLLDELGCESVPTLSSANGKGKVFAYGKILIRCLPFAICQHNRAADIHELLRMNDDAPWERSFQFRPFAVDVFGAYGDGATAILQQLARKRSEHTSMTKVVCKRLAFQSLSVALQIASARMLRSKKDIVAPLPLLPQLPGAAN